MGQYFDAASTRTTVSTNLNRIRACFGLNQMRLNELMQPISAISYAKTRRLALSERDITAQELMALYELLAVPTTTFLYPWTITSTERTSQPHEKTYGPDSPVPPREYVRLSPNPIFDHIGTGILPYRLTGLGNWLVGQSISRVTSDSTTLFDFAVHDVDHYGFRRHVARALNDYVRASFPMERYRAALRQLHDAYPIRTGERLDPTDRADFLTLLGHALTAVMHREAFIGLYGQITTREGDDTLIGSQLTREDIDKPMEQLMGDYKADVPSTPLTEYTEQAPFTIITRLSRTPHKNGSETLTLRAMDAEGETTAVSIPFPYTDWFTMPLPAPVRPPRDRQGLIWEGNLSTELARDLHDHQKPSSHRRFEFLHPRFILAQTPTMREPKEPSPHPRNISHTDE